MEWWSHLRQMFISVPTTTGVTCPSSDGRTSYNDVGSLVGLVKRQLDSAHRTGVLSMLQQFTHADRACGFRYLKSAPAVHLDTSIFSHVFIRFLWLLPPFFHHGALSYEPSSVGGLEMALQVPRCHWATWRQFRR